MSAKRKTNKPATKKTPPAIDAISRDAAWLHEELLKREREASINASIARRKAGIHLSAKVREEIYKALSEMNLAAVAMAKLAALVDDPESQWYGVAIQNMAKVSARKLDFVAALLEDGRNQFGNFSDEFSADKWMHENGIKRGSAAPA